LTDDIVGLFRKRVYDISACDCKKVKVYLNDQLIDIQSFGDYIRLFYPESEFKITYREFNEFWKVGVVYTPEAGFSHMSHVNGIWTYSPLGGTHVSHVCDQVVKGLTSFIEEKYKNIPIKSSYLKDNISLFVNFTTSNPEFGSQTKECLTTKITKFTKRCNIDNSFIISLSKTGIVESVVEFAKAKQCADLKKNDGKKVKRLHDVDNLKDALWAGTRR